MYRNTKNVPYYVFGRGSLAQLGDLLKPRREAVDGPVVYFVDHFFRDHELIGRLLRSGTHRCNQLHPSRLFRRPQRSARSFPIAAFR